MIDNSGSMGGTSITQAKASLIYALGRLKPTDRFNVIRFDNTIRFLFPDTVPADADHFDRARAFVSALEARGGTEMVPAHARARQNPIVTGLTATYSGEADSTPVVLPASTAVSRW